MGKETKRVMTAQQIDETVVKALLFCSCPDINANWGENDYDDFLEVAKNIIELVKIMNGSLNLTSLSFTEGPYEEEEKVKEIKQLIKDVTPKKRKSKMTR